MNDNLNIARFNQLLTVSNPTIVKKNLKKYIPKQSVIDVDEGTLNIHSDKWLLNKELLSISNLKIGNTVKISNNLERFWVKIIELNDNYFLGKIDNYLIFNSEYDYEDIVIFEKENILQKLKAIMTT